MKRKLKFVYSVNREFPVWNMDKLEVATMMMNQ